MMRMLGLGLLLGSAALAMGCESTPTPTGSTPGPDAGPGDPNVPRECTKPTGKGTKHAANIPTETWTADGSPHTIPFDTTVDGTLTIEPCAEVLIAEGKTLTVKGSVVAAGTASKRVHIGKLEAGKPFGKIRTVAGGSLKLSFTTVDGGGEPIATVADLAGMLDLPGAEPTKPVQQTLLVDHVTLAGSMSNGLVLKEGAGFAEGSRNLTISGSKSHPIHMSPRGAGGLPTGAYTGNATDAILFPGGAFVEIATLHDRGVPYHVGTIAGASGDLRVEGPQGGAPATLTIEPGVKLRFKRDGVFHVSFGTGDKPATAALIAVGTAEKPITFTSIQDSPAAGDWLGLSFGQVPLASNKLAFVRVEYAGAQSGSQSASCRASGDDVSNNAAIRIYGPPSSQFITSTTIVSSLEHGIERAWRGGEKVDFLPTNTFQLVGKCNQTFPKDANGACPADPPCPK